MAEYNLSEFRANTRKAFDEAERGEPVYIERYGEDFILISKKNWNDTVGIQKPEVRDVLDKMPKASMTPPAEKNSSLSQAKRNQTDDLGVGEL